MLNIRAVVVVLVLALVVVFFAFDLGQYLTLDYLKSQRQAFLDFYGENKYATLAVYFLIYVAVAALSLPGATVMTLAGGAVFGLATGLLVISFASTIGATIAFIISRFVLRDAVQNKFRDKLKAINAGVEKEGDFYLFTLRLIPLFPFFVINLVMGLTPMKAWRFYLVSQIGMLPGTIVFVNAGSQLGALDSLSGILSPALILSFALLGLFPLLAKKLVGFIKARKVLKGYTKPKTFDYNIAVIGGGSAGLVSSYIAAAVKAKVVLIEKHKMGGDCLNTGCVPSKALIRSAKMLNYAKRAKEFGFKKTTVEFDFGEVMERVQRVIQQVEPHDSVERYSGLGVDVVQAQAKIISPYEIEVDGKILTAKNIIIATGARPAVPQIPGLDDVGYLTSDTVWNIRERPRKLLVLGGGPIGCELAQSFQRLGSEVILVQRGKHVLPREDVEVAEMVEQQFREDGVQVLTAHTAKRFEMKDGQRVMVCDTERGEVSIDFDQLLIALGRQANVKGFGLEALKVKLAAKGTVEADEFLRTNYPNIYVCGDVAGPYQFTHVAAHQAWYAAVNALFSPLKSFRVDYSVIPWATFTDPEVARVGLNELEAKENDIAYEVCTYGIDDLDRAIADSEAHGLVKVLTVPGKDKILGVTIVGTHAGDLIAEFVMAMKWGLGMNKILGTIHIYPTLAEANKYVAGVWKRQHKPESLLQWVERFHAWRRGH
ncbi:MAG: FAD-dependent oxidoreductase [Ectothiorhodospiraceae bacterium]|nr:FAD-dependent oxidoreductase [Ectothiorhodospiraceae bacterium]